MPTATLARRTQPHRPCRLDHRRLLLDGMTDIVLRRCLGRLDRELAVLKAAERRAARGASFTAVNAFLEARLPWWGVPRRCGECGRPDPAIGERLK